MYAKSSRHVIPFIVEIDSSKLNNFESTSRMKSYLLRFPVICEQGHDRPNDWITRRKREHCSIFYRLLQLSIKKAASK